MVQFSPLDTIKQLARGQDSAVGPQTLGRFKLRRILGQGAQSTVWLAFDPRLEREVAIKILRVDKDSDSKAVEQWLAEARSVSRLTHPNIVPVFEADLQDQQPYLVFEYVAGATLADVLKKRGGLPAREAVGLMLDVLEALVAAHGAGVIHLDLKPSNVLVDTAGRARVMDFGIAARIADAADVSAQAAKLPGSGTSGYISPEAANGASPSAAMDIFSAGLVLAEMLTGKPLIAEADPYRAIYRAINEDLQLPATVNGELDDALRAIVLRGLARDPFARHPSASQFLDELKKWLTPQDTSATGPSDSSGALEFLLRRMRHKTDFPALSGSIVRIHGISSSENESVASLTTEILKDVALTNKLLRLINSAHYSRGGAISTVSRAVSLVGFNGIRNMALSLVLLEHMQDKAHANQLKEEFLRCLMAGSIAAELCPVRSESEDAFIGAMFQNLGRLLTQYYFPEEASNIRALTKDRQPQTEEIASRGVLGLNYEDLGIGISKFWNLPEGIRRCMRKPVGSPPSVTPADPAQRIHWIALASNEMSDLLLLCEPKDAVLKLSQLGFKYAKSMGVAAKDIDAATLRAREKLIELALAMDIKVTPGSSAARLLNVLQHKPDDKPQAFEAQTSNAIESNALQATHHLAGSVDEAAQNVQRVSEILAAGIQDITNAMVEDFKLTDVLRMILETMLRAMNFRQIVFCMRDSKTDCITGRFGLGSGVEKIVKTFNIPLRTAHPDLFTMVCTKGTDTMISDASETQIAGALPDWYRKGVNAPTFLLLPLQLKSAPFGMIYADKAEAGGLQLGEKELALLRTLRNQAVMAFKQSS